MPAVDYIKHLVECNCVLPQFKHADPPVWHHFVVFSTYDEKGEIIPSFAQCNNCGIVHKIKEVGLSSIMKKESLASLPTEEDIKAGLPEKLVNMVSKYNLPLPSWQEIAFILENQMWGRKVILTKETVDDTTVGKTLLILGESLWKIDGFQITDEE